MEANMNKINTLAAVLLLGTLGGAPAALADHDGTVTYEEMEAFMHGQ
jgi:hypothetical protein